MNIEFLTPAQSELEEAYTYYEAQRQGLGAHFLDEILRVIKNIQAHPKAWPRFSDRTRRCLASKFPYAVIYQLRENMILIVAVAHLHRKPGYWNERL